MKNTLLFLLAVASIQFSAYSQTKKPAAKPVAKELYTFYTIKNGVKTKVNSDAKITIPVDANGKHLVNIAIEIDVQAFHKKYPYDLISIYVNNYTENDDYSDARVMNFIDPGEAKLMAQTTTKKITLYPESGTAFSDYDSFFRTSNSISTDWNGDSMAFVIKGAYSNGTETYYDDYSSSVKTRQTYTKFTEITPVPTVLFDYDKTYLNGDLNGNLRAKINERGSEVQFNGKYLPTLNGIADKWMEAAMYANTNENMLATRTFILKYINDRLSEFETSTDNSVYMEKLVSLFNETTFLNLGNLTTDEKKALEKLVKKNKTASNDEIVNFFKTANPNPPAVVVDYTPYIAR